MKTIFCTAYEDQAGHGVDQFDSAAQRDDASGKKGALNAVHFEVTVADNASADDVEDAIEVRWRQLSYKPTGEESFNYQLLARLQMDCEYYLGNGNRAVKHLWASTEAEQIAKMKELFAALPVKPDWITLERIEQYEAAMTAQP